MLASYRVMCGVGKWQETKMPHPQQTTPNDDELDIALRQYSQHVATQPVPARFKTLFNRLRASERELEHER